jgi:hypothetical protein
VFDKNYKELSPCISAALFLPGTQGNGIQRSSGVVGGPGAKLPYHLDLAEDSWGVRHCQALLGASGYKTQVEPGPRVTSAQASWGPHSNKKLCLLDDNMGQGALLSMSSHGASGPEQPLATGDNIVLVGVWPGSHSVCLPRFVLCHFQGDWESYLPFGVLADICEMKNPDAIIL